MEDVFEVVRLAATEIRRFPLDTRGHGELAIRAVDAAITEFGEFEPVVLNHEDQVLYGRERVELAAENDSEVTAVRLDTSDWDLERQAALHIALHHVKGRWHAGKLKELVAELKEDGGVDLLATGFLRTEIDMILAPPQADLGEAGSGEGGAAAAGAPENREVPLPRFRAGIANWPIPLELKLRLDSWASAQRTKEMTKPMVVEAALIAIRKRLETMRAEA